MTSRHRLLLAIVSLFSCLSLVLAAEPTSFCKCTCFSNSTIIQLGPPNPSGSGLSEIDSRDLYGADLFLRPRADSDSNDDDNDEAENKGDDKKYRSLNCNDCNRKLCMEHQLPKCKGAAEEDIVTTCFQRDSHKDQAVVFIFIIATAGLLLWAAIKPCAERWVQAARERRSYIPLSAQEDDDR